MTHNVSWLVSKLRSAMGMSQFTGEELVVRALAGLLLVDDERVAVEHEHPRARGHLHHRRNA
jgi:hypothetical protein